MAIVEDRLVYPTLIKLAACLCEELEAAGFNTCFCGIVPGAEAVLDFCGDGSACEEGGRCGGMGWVRLVAAAPRVDPGTPAGTSPASCRSPLEFQIEVGAAFCAPMVSSDGSAPSLSEQLDATRKQIASMAAMRRAIACCMAQSDEVDYELQTYSPLPILGGCMGGYWTLLVDEWRGPLP